MNEPIKIEDMAKILIVDDDKKNLLALEKVLQDLPADIISATSGEEALSLITEHEFAVVLLDVQMPGMDGFETAELMRKNRYTEAIPIIFVTALSKEKIHVFKGYQSGAVDYLFKPIEPFLLQSKVQIFLDIYYQKTQRLVSLLRELQSVKLQLESNNRELQKIASHDSLTELPNRRQFEDELDRCLSYAKRYDDKFALLFVDVDNFKAINDNFGHVMGDNILRLISTKILSKLRQEDFFARLGGDEFAIILTHLNAYEHAGAVAENIRKLFQSRHFIDETNVYVTLSIGIACYPHAGTEPNELIQNADIAMYRAKDAGKNKNMYFSEKLSEDFKQRAQVEKNLQQALANAQFHMVYQPIFDLKTNKAIGVEALIRWEHPVIGNISPAEFIPISEEMGLIQQIGEWIIHTACEQFSIWCEQGFTDYKYAINLSPKQLQQPELAQYTIDALTEFKIDPTIITFELTETMIMQDNLDSESMISQIHDMGIKISIDDFGTGYSSLVRLRHLPIQTLKIDQSFVNDIGVDDSGDIIIKTILSLAHSLGLSTVAEGIETEAQLKFLRDNNCQYGQGFYLSKPVAGDEIPGIFKQGEHDGK
ncbi:MAG: EAL domain-containing protein [Coxiellaceae bacterium]|nr:EAL domain-containing protein [Coxiellaceae bacterium]